jgi:hypothetical protein
MFEESLRLHSVRDPEYEVERRVFDKIQDRLITGQFDILYNGKHLYDIKTCKVWKKVFDPDMVEWHQQLNLYAWMLRNRGLDIKSINIIAVYMDWQKQRAFRDDGYPPEPIVEYELQMWQDTYAEEYMNTRVRLMKDSEMLPDNELPLCTMDEMWQREKDTKYAVFQKKDAARAAKVCDTIDAATEFALSKKCDIIEVRRPERTRCENWCDGRDWCNQYREYAARKEAGTKEIINL